ncbi:MAG: MarR family transcriptional regulator [Anaerolineae bacterium]|nr:MarR family transcriptional regulator [Anaerolineae bacterium]
MESGLEQDISAFWSILFSILGDVEKRLAAHMAAHDLTPPQFFVLKTLIEHGGSCPIGEIARDHHLTSATMTGLVKRLEAMDPPLVVRQRSRDDARSVNVVLTDEGQTRFDAIKDTVFDQLQLILSLISEEERQALLHFLARYLELVAQVFPMTASAAER